MSLNDNWFEYKVIIYRVKQLICSHPNYVIEMFWKFSFNRLHNFIVFIN